MKNKAEHTVLKINPVLSVIIFSGMIGFCLGLSNATWQQSVEIGQILTGIVKYPADNPNYIILIKLFSVSSHLTALILLLTDSEIITSFIITGLLGMVSFQAVSLFVFAINRNAYISIFGVILIYFMRYVTCVYDGIIYPINFFEWNTFGVLGLSFVVLVIALIGAEVYKLGFFLLGLAPYIHVPWAAWLFGVVFLSLIFHPGFAKKIIKEYYPYFIAGIFITVLSLIYQFHLMRNSPVIDPDMKRQYYINFVKHWDYHRQKFYWDYKIREFRFFKDGVVFCIYSIILSFTSLMYFKNKNAPSFLFRLIIISGISSLLLCGLTHISPEKLPQFLVILMPARFINFNNIILPACFIGILTSSSHKQYNYYIFALFVLVGIIMNRNWIIIHHQNFINFSLVLLWIIYNLIKKDLPENLKAGYYISKIKLLFKADIFYYGKIFFGVAIICLIILLPKQGFFSDNIFKAKAFADRTNDKVYAVAYERKGILAITSDFFLTSVRTRRPVLIDAQENFDGFNTALESGDILNNMLKKVYGFDLLIPLPEYLPRPRSGGIPSILHKTLWEKRTIEEWQEIRKEFGVTDILTKTDWNLLLPIVAEENEKILYEIPVNG
ncbi:MAG: hypothetical protein GY795_38310 [Desulfobacterales bacterium]|nr:hypothetical protein [Desulfobacterales bacterium]